MLYEVGARGILERQADLLKTQSQLSSGRRILAPSDDPIAASHALAIAQSRDLTAQHAANVTAARNALSIAESAVGDLQEALASTRELILSAGNASLGDADRRSIAADLRARLATILEIANRRDSNNRALFGGFAEDTIPFIDSGSTVSYTGDQGTRSLAVSPTRAVAVGVSGAALFQGIPVGNGTFATASDPANAGAGSISVGSVVERAALTGHDYDIVFQAVGPVTTYSIVNRTLGVTVSSGNPFTSGAAVAFDGLQVRLSGTPADGDRFTVEPAGRQDVFTALRQAIDLLETPTATAAARGALMTGLERGLADVDQASERALAVRTQFGATLRELDAVDGAQTGLAVEYDRQLSQLQDLDYAKAVSDFTREQQALEAAQKVFKATTQLSLFSLL
jgi:flagellar hook-associated protein 3 FlgL